MTSQDTAGDGEDVRTLPELIAARLGERGWSTRDLQARTDHVVKHQSWSKYAKGQMDGFPRPATLMAMAKALEVDVTTVVLAVSRTLNLPVYRHGPALAHLLPAGTDLLSDTVRNGLLAIIRACVEDAVAQRHGRDDEGPAPPASSGAANMPSGIYEWDEGDELPGRRNANRRAADLRG